MYDFFLFRVTSIAVAVVECPCLLLSWRVFVCRFHSLVRRCLSRTFDCIASDCRTVMNVLSAASDDPLSRRMIQFLCVISLLSSLSCNRSRRPLLCSYSLTGKPEKDTVCVFTPLLPFLLSCTFRDFVPEFIFVTLAGPSCFPVVNP